MFGFVFSFAILDLFASVGSCFGTYPLVEGLLKGSQGAVNASKIRVKDR